jgi:HEAT repeat protein
LTDFATSFQAIEETLRAAAGNVMGKIDQISFRMLTDCLKSPDYQVVVDTLEQLEKEKRAISIPPVYFLSAAHPDKRIRARAARALAAIDPEGDAEKLAIGKEPDEAVRLLIQKYGNFRK